MSENPWELEDAYVRVAAEHGLKIPPASIVELVDAHVSPADFALHFDALTIRPESKGPRPAKRLPKPYTPAEWTALMVATRNRPDVRAALVFLRETGMRSAEALSISRDVALSWPTPRRFFWRAPVVRIIGKGNKERPVLLNREAVAAAYVLAHSGRTPRDGLFPWTDRGLRYVIAEAGKKVGVHAHPHRCRHSHLSEMVEAGNTIDVVADIAGHSKVDVTRRYYFASEEARRRADGRRRRYLRRRRTRS